MLKKQFFLTPILFLFLNTAVSGQMFLGQHLNDIKQEHPVGSLLTNENYGYTYGVTKQAENDYYLFFVNKDLYCYLTVLNPLSSTSLQAWIEELNKKWVVVDNYHWRYYRNDTKIVYAELRKVDNVNGLCIGFSFVK